MTAQNESQDTLRAPNGLRFLRNASTVLKRPKPCVNQIPPSVEDRILSIFPREASTNDTQGFQLNWYTPWVQKQIIDSGSSMFSPLKGVDEGASEQSILEKLSYVWVDVAQHLNSNPASIDDIVKRLRSDGSITVDIEASDKDHHLADARSLVFAIIGWQTLLYIPDSGSTPPSILSIADDTEGFRCTSRLSLKQERTMCRRPLVECLNRFGVFLPPAGFVPQPSEDTGQDSSSSHAVSRAIDPSSFNAFLLSSVTKTRIKWVESLSCHLEFDEAANVLFVFRYPSFCLVNFLGPRVHKGSQGPVHACAKSIGKLGQWATIEEVDHFLLEILLSYRLLFGQTKQGRQLYRKLESNSGCTTANIFKDPLLTDLCARKHCNSFMLERQRESYDTTRDLVILKSRFIDLQRYLAQKKPRTWMELWNDKRDSAQWFTFWAVLIIGGLGVVLALMQVVLQAIQLGVGQ